MLSTLYTHGHHLITAVGCAFACAVTSEINWKGAKNTIGNVSFIALSTLCFVGTRRLGAAYIQSPSLYGTVGRGAVHAVGGIVGMLIVDRSIDKVLAILKKSGY